MRKLWLFPISVVLFFSCDQGTKPQISASPNLQKESKHKSLLTKYKDISFDTLKVFSAEDLESVNYKYKGIKLDSIDVMLFPKELTDRYTFDNYFFACFKFAI